MESRSSDNNNLYLQLWLLFRVPGGLGLAATVLLKVDRDSSGPTPALRTGGHQAVVAGGGIRGDGQGFARSRQLGDLTGL
ncbi:MAG: hypothetical protein LJE59_00485 [Chromatiaceae bacterium]|jgi:hypothetical protein|nr:hypothetical protein [Chromatiaceae bacterium]